MRLKIIPTSTLNSSQLNRRDPSQSMKLKLGKLTFGPRALWKIVWLLFAQGVLIGLMVAAKQDGHTVSPALFIVVNVIIIPAMARGLFRDENNGIDRTNE